MTNSNHIRSSECLPLVLSGVATDENEARAIIARRSFVVRDDLTGRYQPERFDSYRDAVNTYRQGMFTIRRLDEVLAETGRA